MNLIEGSGKNGAFAASDVNIKAQNVPNGPVTLGFRAEDAQIAETGEGQINSTIYTLELLGDATMVTVRIDGTLVSVKADKNFRAEIHDPVSIRVPTEICHLFDAQTGARIGE